MNFCVLVLFISCIWNIETPFPRIKDNLHIIIFLYLRKTKRIVFLFFIFRVNVASLLTVLLLGRMEYLTEILRLLLGRLIFSTAANKHPQLMLRRTETVVEKMLSNWFALTMFTYLKVCQ